MPASKRASIDDRIERRVIDAFSVKAPVAASASTPPDVLVHAVHVRQ
ncbi:hypothetical protein [Burkholderia oklahomensis]|nr:hypothetical protein [Burkholderia oklahomensis]QPS41007.1 hypothetical protein I6G57_22440 [Burkholderia oklahomensis]